MKQKAKQWMALFLIGSLCTICLTACAEEQETSSSTEESSVAEEDLPFGATLQELDTTKIPIEYDNRYFTEDEMTVLTNYFYAIQTEDVTLYQESTLDFWTDYVVEQMFQGLVGVDGLLTQLKYSYTPQASETATDSTDDTDSTEDSTESETEADVTFEKINIVECEQSTDTTHSNLDNLYTMLDELSGEEDYCTNHVSDAKFLNLSLSLASGEESTTISDQYVFLVCVDGQYLICA